MAGFVWSLSQASINVFQYTKHNVLSTCLCHSFIRVRLMLFFRINIAGQLHFAFLFVPYPEESAQAGLHKKIDVLCYKLSVVVWEDFLFLLFATKKPYFDYVILFLCFLSQTVCFYDRQSVSVTGCMCL